MEQLEAARRRYAQAKQAVAGAVASAVAGADSRAGAPPPPAPRAPAVAAPPRDPQLNAYVLATALGAPDGASFTELARALLGAEERAGKGREARARVAALLLRLAFYEDPPGDVVARLLPLARAAGKDVRVARMLLYLFSAYAGGGGAGTPAPPEPAAAAAGAPPRRPDERAVAAIAAEALRLAEAPDTEPGARRAAFFLLAAAARSSEGARREALGALERAVAAADALGAARGAGGKGGSAKGRLPAAADWELQHTVFGARRAAGGAPGDGLSRAAAVGVASPDAVGARHALALAAEAAARDPAAALRELGAAVAEAADAYETSGPGAPRAPGAGVNTADAFARAALARLCAAVAHGDTSAADLGRGGGPFWRMLVLLATRDPHDMVRFAALEAIAAGAAAPALAPPGAAGGAAGAAAAAREAAGAAQRRARAWRLLVAQAGAPVAVPGAAAAAAAGEPLKLIDALGRLLALALAKPEAAARFCRAAAVVGALAEAAVAARGAAAGPGGAGASASSASSPDVDRVMGALARELGALAEGPLPPALRAACAEALLLLQAAGHEGGLTPEKLARGGAGGGRGLQEALLSAVLRCARARPADAARFLAYAPAVVGLAPSAMDLSAVVALWDAAAAAGRGGRATALAAAAAALRAPPPPAAATRAGAGPGDAARAAREDDGWRAFAAAAAWWLGERSNELCDEFVGRPLPASCVEDPGEAAAKEGAAAGEGGGGSDAGSDGGSGAGGLPRGVARAAAPPPAELAARHAGRNPALAAVIAALADAAATAHWRLRAAATRALAKLALRSGEPYRLHAYAALATAAGGPEDALGLAAAARPALALLDRVYAAQARLGELRAAHGADAAGWPDDVVASVARRAAALRAEAERAVCALPRERYAILGPLAAGALARAGEAAPAYAADEAARGAGGDASLSAGGDAGASLARAKDREVEDILSFGGGSDAASGASFAGFVTAAPGAGSASAAASARDAEVESLLSGGGAPAPAAWSFSPAPSPRAAAPGGLAAVNAFAEPGSPAARSPRGGAGGFFGAARADSAEPAPASPPAASTAPAQAAAAAALGAGVMRHTFIADAAHPEELSVFGGDSVEVLGEADGWVTVRAPGGATGLVPAAYVELDSGLAPAGGSGGGGGGGAFSGFGAPAPAAAAAPAGGDVWSRMAAAGGGGGGGSAGGSAAGGSAPASPMWGAAPAPAAAAPPPSMWAAPPSPAPAPAPLARQASGASAGNPFGAAAAAHRRNASVASAASHQRTLSDSSALEGSIPGSPSRFDGPERAVVAAFTAEMEGELTVAAGERVKVHSQAGGWARVLRLADRRAGLVPTWAVGEA